MHARIFRVILLTLLWSSTILSTVAQAASEEGGGNRQSPTQVGVQIVVTAIVLKVLTRLNLP